MGRKVPQKYHPQRFVQNKFRPNGLMPKKSTLQNHRNSTFATALSPAVAFIRRSPDEGGSVGGFPPHPSSCFCKAAMFCLRWCACRCIFPLQFKVFHNSAFHENPYALPCSHRRIARRLVFRIEIRTRFGTDFSPKRSLGVPFRHGQATPHDHLRAQRPALGILFH